MTAVYSTVHCISPYVNNNLGTLCKQADVTAYRDMHVTDDAYPDDCLFSPSEINPQESSSTLRPLSPHHINSASLFWNSASIEPFQPHYIFLNLHLAWDIRARIVENEKIMGPDHCF
jgi:hypothetical protein